MDKNLGHIILVIFDENNLGPVTLYEILSGEGYSCKVVYYLRDTGTNRETFISFLRETNAVLLGFSFASHSKNTAMEVADYVADKMPELPIIFGGVHPTIDPLSCLSSCDAVCVGEGEGSMLEIAEKTLNGQDYLSAHNLVYKKDGEIIRNEILPLIQNLDDLPIRRPCTDDHIMIEKGEVVILDKKKYMKLYHRFTRQFAQTFSRGCPYACSYCCNSKFHEIYKNWGKIRSKSVRATIMEIREYIKFNPDIIKVFIIDDCFLTHSAEWLTDFVRRWNADIRKEFNFFTIPDYVTDEKLDILKGLDLCYCSIGLQSGSKKINGIYKRKFSREEFMRACGAIHSRKLGLVISVILDNPWEDDKDVMETLDVLTEIRKPFYIMQYSLKIYPGTRLFDHCRENSVKTPDNNMDYQNFFAIRSTDTNKIVILSQFLPKGLISHLFRNKGRLPIKFAVRGLYILACCIMPFHALRVAGSKHFINNLRLASSYRNVALLWVKGLLGLR